MRGTTLIARISLALPALDSPNWQNPLRTFASGMRAVGSTVMMPVLFSMANW
jgi:hypothetical protein